jgi:hypothetical protein
MNRLTFPAATLALLAIQGCATLPHPVRVTAAAAGTAPAIESVVDISHAGSCADTAGCPVHATPVAHVTEVPIEKAAPPLQGHPLTSVVVTQCNLIVAVYMTMPDGRLLRYDHSASISVDQLLDMAYTATRSERVEVSCNDTGAVGYEKHDPV